MPTTLATLLHGFVLLPDELHARAASQPSLDASVTFSAEVRASGEGALRFCLTITTERVSASAAVEADTASFQVAGGEVRDLRFERWGEVAAKPRVLPLTDEGVARLLGEVRAFCEVALPGVPLADSPPGGE